MKLSSFGRIASKQKIDKDAGIIHGVSVISKGEALGHELVIDSKTLTQVAELASQFSDGLKVRLNHPEGKGGTVQSIVGALKNFRVDGSQVRADLHLLKSDENYDKIFELAETQPENFGLSIVFSGKSETEDDLKLARCTEIYACDLVDTPAANPTGLFSKPEITMSKTIKYAKGDSGEHAKDCDCKMCMEAKDGKKDSKMSEIYAAMGLEENATAAEFIAALTAKAKPADDKTLADRLAKLEAQDAQTLALSQKAQIDTLLSEASRDGKKVPFELAELYTEKDGKVTILETPEKLGKIISKLEKGAVLTKKNKMDAPKNADGKVIEIFGLGKSRRANQEQKNLVRSFCEQKQAENAPVFGKHIKQLHRQALEGSTTLN
jgi:hypothetical protein